MRIKRNGVHVSGKEVVKGVWCSHFECLMKEKTEREAIVSSMGVEAGGKGVCGWNNCGNRWKKAIIVPLHKSKASKDECNN